MFDPSFDWLRARKAGILSEHAGGPVFKLKLILQADKPIHKTKWQGPGCSKEHCSATYWLKFISQRFIIGAVRLMKQSRTFNLVSLTLSFYYLCADYWRDRACK